MVMEKDYRGKGLRLLTGLLEVGTTFFTKEGTLLFWKMEDDLYLKNERQLNIIPNGRQPSFIWKMEDDLNYLENGRRPQYFGK